MIRLSVSTLIVASSLAALAGCASAAPPPVVVPDGVTASGYRMSVRPDTAIRDAADRALAQAYIDETLRVIGTPAFERNLVAIGDEVGTVWRGPLRGRWNSRAVAAAYLGRVPAHRASPSMLRWVSDEKVAKAGWVNGYRDDMVISLGTQRKRWWASGGVTERSCAINSLAHELSHTLPRSQTNFGFLFTDGARDWSTRFSMALASYVIGAVAQCTYLEEHGRMTGGSLAACVEEWGESVFKTAGCS